MRRIALEEAFWLPELGEETHPFGHLTPRNRQWVDHVQSRLLDMSELRLREMDEFGIDIHVLSLTSPGVQAHSDPASASRDARLSNEVLSSTIAAHPDRFAGFAALPTQDPEAAAKELEHSVTELGLRGALVNDHTFGRYLDDRAYDVLWDKVQELGVPLYIHPNALSAQKLHVLTDYEYLSGGSFGWSVAVGGHALRLIYGRVFDRFPGATVILGHMGEFLPFQTTRLDSRHANLTLADPPELNPSEYLRRNFMITTSGVCSHPAVVAAVEAIGADRVMFAIDYPYEETSTAAGFLDTIPLPTDQLELIAHRNAERVLGLTPA
ncbi:amidohydrolase family protein [Rhodococcus sp. (in: high G+C Gram-positive bacteria)]|uniref:amidohydrolase family protein n=1 Tax=Rhodococcus sp. TaxID=1831 RepID=UPI00257A1655|nr:amidohydrolase family protein [Rhodococcus sp. (in: high G+C Gram-positive bacteria)]MBQ7804043.1 amidohydrolase [Rhodococcus sp. (in: high G+C Gram-positive bacteria)]